MKYQIRLNTRGWVYISDEKEEAHFSIYNPDDITDVCKGKLISINPDGISVVVDDFSAQKLRESYLERIRNNWDGHWFNPKDKEAFLNEQIDMGFNKKEIPLYQDYFEHLEEYQEAARTLLVKEML